jgi:hypothetical protein
MIESNDAFPLIIVLTPWLALSWLARAKVLRAAQQRFPVAVFVLVARVSQRPGRKLYRCACQRRSVKPVEIGRLVSASWLVWSEILLFPYLSKQTGFTMFPTLILTPRFYW